MKILLLPTTLLLVSLPVQSGERIAVAEAHPVASVVASGEYGKLQQPANLTNRSGMNGDRHDNNSTAGTMWHTAENPAPTSPVAGLPAVPAWVRCDLAHPAKIAEVLVWNHNQAGFTNRGFRKTKVYGSADGSNWKLLADVELKQGGDTAQAVALSNSASPIKSVIIAAESNWGGNVYGLSEVEFVSSNLVDVDAAPFPAELECLPQPFYRHRKDGKAGRELTVKFSGGKLYGDAVADIAVAGGPSETIPLAANPRGAEEVCLLLPAGVGVDTEAQVSLTIKRGKHAVSKQATIPTKRQWTVYIYPGSHVDIGYTNTQANVERIHKRNLEVGIELAKKTADWPQGSRFVWNPEVTWPIERYLATATPTEREIVYDAIRKGWVGVDAGYINDNTSVACGEELFPFMAYGKKLEAETGVKVDSLVQADVPGMSWGMVPAAAKNGVRYIMLLPNGGDRTGLTATLDHRPFWWEGPDGKSRVLVLQPGAYAYGAGIKGRQLNIINRMLGQTDTAKLDQMLDSVKTADPRANFADKLFLPATASLEKRKDYPYDLFAMAWYMNDNVPVDQDLPEAVRSWNAEYAYPHLIIAGTNTIMSAFEKKYGDQLPVMRGDFTEYWTDGLGTAAKHTGMNRTTKERIIQADTLWTMLNPGKPAPRVDFDEAWRYVVLGSEHTWAFSDPNKQPLQNEILNVKFGYFEEAKKRSESLLAGSLAPVSAEAGSQVAVFNTLSWARDGLATLSAAQAKAGDRVKDEAGNPVPSQRLSTGELVFAAGTVPAFGAQNYTIASGSPAQPAKPVKIAGLTLDNGMVKVTLDETTGDIASLVMDGREFVDQKAPCRLNSYRYLRGRDNGVKATGPTDVKISVKENGPLVASLLVESKAEGCNKLLREVRLTAGSAEVACDDLVDKIAITNKEGVHFGFAFDLPAAKTRMDIPWGVAEVEKDQLPAGNRNWICFQRWLDVSNDDAGVVWSALDAPTFEYGGITANILGGALRSPAWKRKLEPSSTIYSWALNNHWHTNFPLSQSGLIPFRYRLLPHAGGFDAAAANRFGTAQAQPLVATPVKAKVALAPQVKLDNPRVQATILRSEKGGRIVLYLRSLSDKAETATLIFPDGKTKTFELAPWGMEQVSAGG